MKGYMDCSCYLDKKEHIINTRKYIIIEKKGLVDNKKVFVVLQAKLPISQNWFKPRYDMWA